METVLSQPKDKREKSMERFVARDSYLFRTSGKTGTAGRSHFADVSAVRSV
jgi:hypothetical protein